jgi:hypothetical protein
MNEPTTVITDYVLGALAAYLAWQLFRRRGAERSRRWWSRAFVALALGAFLGGTWHGFARNEWLWKATLLTIGIASSAMMIATAFATLPARARSAVIGVAAAMLLVYAGWIIVDDRFIAAIADTAIAFALVAALHLWKWNGAILAGVAVSVVAALVQASGLALHAHFNHNDLYHVIQAGAMLLFYRGARVLKDS